MLKEIEIKGKHGKFIDDLTKAVLPNTQFAFFPTNVSVYTLAPIIGFQYKRRAEEDKSSDDNKKINYQQIMKNRNRIAFNYHIIQLLSSADTIAPEKRIEKAFRYPEVDEDRAKQDEDYKNSAEYIGRKENEALYYQYLLGGIEVLHEKLVMNAGNEDEAYFNIYDFVEEFEREVAEEQSLYDLFNEIDY